MTNLVAELFTAQEALADRPALVAQYDLPTEVVIWGWIGLARVILNNCGLLYRPDPAGKPCLITPVKLGDPMAATADVIKFGEIVDLVAWHPRRSNRWALRTGEGIVLGHAELGTNQKILPNPYVWVMAGGDGLCVLQPLYLAHAA